ncbi:MAG: DMT family transporter [Gammaproteobacteria bacterium]|nr:DMT family transporter [Gammaproteobacteria bacterium]
MTNQHKAYLFALSAVLLWSTVATAFKISLRYLDVFQLLLVASATGTLCLLLVVVLTGRLKIPASLGKRDYLRLACLGVLNPFCYYLVLFRAYDLLPAQVAQALNYTWAITLMLLSVPILKHRLTRFDCMATVICYSGVLVICFSGSRFPEGELSAQGIFLALGSTIIWAFYWLLKTKDHVEPVTGLFISFLFSIPFIAAACWLWSDPSSISAAGILSGVYVGLFEMGVTYILWLAALRLSETAAKVSTLIFLSPFLSLIFISRILGEAVAVTTIVGLVLIVAGLLVQHFRPQIKN